MRADLFLVRHGHFDTRARAQAAIAAGKVTADGAAVTKPSQKISEGARIVAEEAFPWVSRAALKLEAGLEAFGVDPADRVCLDIGASTGGFTEVLLSRGARHVYAVDVGREQLHPRLQADSRVTSMEGMDARNLSADMFCEPPSLVVCDASFISLLKVITRPLALAAPKADLIALIKPQFEVGRASVGKGGLVKSESERQRAVKTVCEGLESMTDFVVRAVIDSPVEGGDGNREYLMAATRPGQS